MTNRTPLLAAALLLALSAAPLAAQSLRGQLLDEQSGAPVVGALVVLLDAASAQRAGALSGADGRFVLTPPQPGAYRVRAERIGYTTVTAPAVQVGAGETPELTLRLAPAAVSLEGVSVVAASGRRCEVRPAQGREAYAIWEAARKALASAALTDAQSGFLYDQTVYEDVLDAQGTQVTEAGRRRSARVRRPFHSLPLEQLLERGFVQQSDSGAVYYAPDASVLLSDGFLDHHCFRAAEPHPGEASLVGLAFEPVGRRGAAGITGTLWVDRGSSELRYLEFRYPSPRPGISNALLGGRVEFYPLPTGEWIVRRWWLRTPRVGQETGRTPTGQQTDRFVLTGLIEHGGEIVRVSRRTGEPVFAHDAVTVPPVAAAQVGAAPPSEPGGASPAAAPRAAAAGAAPSRRRDASRITRTEIERATASNLLELVQSERPQWLRSRGTQTLRLGTVSGARGEQYDAMAQLPIVVYFDGIRIGTVASLQAIPAGRAASVQFVDARAATQRWGTDHGAGVILVSSM